MISTILFLYLCIIYLIAIYTYNILLKNESYTFYKSEMLNYFYSDTDAESTK